MSAMWKNWTSHGTGEWARSGQCSRGGKHCHGRKPALPCDPSAFTVIKGTIIQRTASTKWEQSIILLQSHKKNCLVCLGKGSRGYLWNPKATVRFRDSIQPEGKRKPKKRRGKMVLGGIRSPNLPVVNVILPPICPQLPFYTCSPFYLVLIY